MTHIVKIQLFPASDYGVSAAKGAAQNLIAHSNHSYHASTSAQRYAYVIRVNDVSVHDGPQRYGPEAVSDAVPRGMEVSIYGYPLAKVEMTRRVVSGVEQPAGTHAPMG